MPSLIRPSRRFPRISLSGFMALIVLLALSSGPAYAEWVAIATIDNATIYIDTDAIRRKGNLVKLWYLLDFKTVQNVSGKSFLSSRTQEEYDCTEDRERILAMAMFSENMGSGNPVFHDSHEGEWTPVHPDSAGKVLWKLACKKK